MSALRKLRQVYWVASDLEAQVAFYRDVLGLELAFRDGGRWVQFRAGEVSIALASGPEGQGVPPGIPVPVLEVDDLDVSLARVRAAGREMSSVRDMGDHGRSVRVRDPAGVQRMLLQR